MRQQDSIPDMRTTSLNSSERVSKSHPVIELRGRLDSLNAQIIFFQACSDNPGYISDLEELRKLITRLQRCEALCETFGGPFVLWGMTEDEIHTRSHQPGRFYHRGHVLPHHDMGREASSINLIRTSIREAELCACRAYDEDTYGIIHVLNRLSSAAYILIYKYLPKDFSYEFKPGRSLT